jgi:hypothetical protein
MNHPRAMISSDRNPVVEISRPWIGYPSADQRAEDGSTQEETQELS